MSAGDISARTGSKAGCQPTILPSVDYDATRAVLTALERHGVRYAVFGAVALNLKRDTVRLKDKADAEMLRRQFDLGEQD